MPEVVYPKNKGKQSRTWNEVFPIWDQNAEQTDWRVINEILEAIAMNNRFGGKTPAQLKKHIQGSIDKWLAKELEENLAEFQALSNPELHGLNGVLKSDITPEHEKAEEKRRSLFATYGRYSYYIKEVFANLGGAYREFKR
jgi:hypothetical protein